MFSILCEESLLVRPRLATDEIGFVAIPKYTNTFDDKSLSARAKIEHCICIIDTLISFIIIIIIIIIHLYSAISHSSIALNMKC